MTVGNEFVLGRPHPALRPFVARYLGYRQHGVTLTEHRGLPSRHITLVISLADPLRIEGQCLPAAVGGLHTRSVVITQDAYQCGVHVDLNPLGVQALLDASAAELSGHVVSLADLGRPPLASLPERLHASAGWPERFGLLDDVLRGSLRSAFSPRPEVGWAWRRLVSSGGRGAVTSLAREVGWSARHFSERFRAEIGLAPKQAARVLRFERASDTLRRVPHTPLADLAADCGFYDQAHLSNEWRALAGCSPRTWITEELPFLS